MSEMTTVAFVSYKGGVGRTTCAWNAARVLAARGTDVTIVDLDVDAPGLSHLAPKKAGQKPEGLAYWLHDLRGPLEAEPNFPQPMPVVADYPASTTIRVLPSRFRQENASDDLNSSLDHCGTSLEVMSSERLWNSAYGRGDVLKKLLRNLRTTRDSEDHVVLLDIKAGINVLTDEVVNGGIDSFVVVMTENDQGLIGTVALLANIFVYSCAKDLTEFFSRVVVVNSLATRPFDHDAFNKRVRRMLGSLLDDVREEHLPLPTVVDIPFRYYMMNRDAPTADVDPLASDSGGYLAVAQALWSAGDFDSIERKANLRLQRFLGSNRRPKLRGTSEFKDVLRAPPHERPYMVGALPRARWFCDKPGDDFHYENLFLSLLAVHPSFRSRERRAMLNALGIAVPYRTRGGTPLTSAVGDLRAKLYGEWVLVWTALKFVFEPRDNGGEWLEKLSAVAEAFVQWPLLVLSLEINHSVEETVPWKSRLESMLADPDLHVFWKSSAFLGQIAYELSRLNPAARTRADLASAPNWNSGIVMSLFRGRFTSELPEELRLDRGGDPIEVARTARDWGILHSLAEPTRETIGQYKTYRESQSELVAPWVLEFFEKRLGPVATHTEASGI